MIQRVEKLTIARDRASSPFLMSILRQNVLLLARTRARKKLLARTAEPKSANWKVNNPHTINDLHNNVLENAVLFAPKCAMKMRQKLLRDSRQTVLSRMLYERVS
jgi:hypothetical protein